MELLRHTTIQVRVVVSENNPHGPPEFFKPMSYFRVGSYGRQQIFIQSKESRTGARYGFELLIQERREFNSNLSIPEESADLAPGPFIVATATDSERAAEINHRIIGRLAG